MKRRAFVRFVGTVIVAAAVAGCDGTKNKVVPVIGKVVYTDGKPLPAGTVVLFEPTEGNVATASGATGDDGSFMMTHANGSTGAEEGKYTVKLFAPKGHSAEFDKTVPKSYAEGSMLSVEVKDGMAPVMFKVPANKKK